MSMSRKQNPKTESENFSKLMNYSMHSSNKEDTLLNSNKSSRLRLRSNTIFAFQDDHLHSYIYPSEYDDHTGNNFKENHDTFYIPNNNLNSSNFFSTVCDRSQWIKFNDTTDARMNDDAESIGSITEDMERQLAFLNEVDDDLNDAKLSLNENEDQSLNGEKFLNNGGMFTSKYMNMTTPYYPSIRPAIETEDIKQMNNFNTQQSFSSICTTNNGGTSNCSSFVTDEHKARISNANPTNMQILNKLKNYDAMSNSITNANISTQPVNDLHAKSVDFTNMSSMQHSNYHSFQNGNKIFPAYTHPLEHEGSLTSCHSISSFNSIPCKMTYMQPIQYSPANYANPFMDGKNVNSLYFAHKNNFGTNEEKYIIDNLPLLVKDQNGCRMLQKKLEERNNEFISNFYDKIKNILYEIMCDQFGNYVIQKLIETCDKSIITKMVEKLKGKMLQLSVHNYGTRALQKLFDFISLDSEYETVKEILITNVFTLIKDLNGNHVIQKIILVFPTNRNSFIMQEITNHIVEISKIKQGGCIFLKALEKSNEEDKCEMVWKILKNIDQLINDEHGNFIIQYILNLKREQFSKGVFAYVTQNIIQLSKHKFSSNVIDKCILYEDQELRGSLIDRLIHLKCVPELITDQFVVQKALQVSSGIKFFEILDMIKKSAASLRQTKYGKRIYDNIILNYGQYFKEEKTKDSGKKIIGMSNNRKNASSIQMQSRK